VNLYLDRTRCRLCNSTASSRPFSYRTNT